MVQRIQYSYAQAVKSINMKIEILEIPLRGGDGGVVRYSIMLDGV